MNVASFVKFAKEILWADWICMEHPVAYFTYATTTSYTLHMHTYLNVPRTQIRTDSNRMKKKKKRVKMPN